MSLKSLDRKLVSGEVRKLLFSAVKRERQKIMASRVEVRFIDESDFVNKGNDLSYFFCRLGARFHDGSWKKCNEWQVEGTLGCV